MKINFQAAILQQGWSLLLFGKYSLILLVI